MGIYDRDYYRDDDGGFWSNLGGRRATVWLVGVTVGVFVLQLITRDPRGDAGAILTYGAFDAAAVLHGQVWRLVTAYFVNYPFPGSLLPLAFGMYMLYMLGSAVENIYGKREFLAYYLTAGLVASLTKLLFFAAWGQQSVSFGHGVPVTAVLVLYACHFPHTRFYLLIVILPCPAWLLVTGIVLLNALGFMSTGGGIGPAETLVAVAFAFTYYWQDLRVMTLVDGLIARLPGRRPRSRADLRVYRDDPADRRGENDGDPVPAAPTGRQAAATRAARSVDEQLEAKLDQVLEKVARFGRDSLTPEENGILLRASEIYKRRRGS